MSNENEKDRKRWPLSLHLTLSFFVIISLILGVGGTLFLRQVTHRLILDQSNKVLAQARVAASLASEERFQELPQALPLTLFTFHQQTGMRPLLVDSEGLVVADSWIPSPLANQPLPHPEVKTALAGREATGWRFLPQEGWVFYAAVPVQSFNKTTGAMLLAANMNDLAGYLTDLQQQLVIALAVTGLVAVFIAFWLARILSKPLEHLDQAAAAVASGDLGTRVIPEGSREVAVLGERFNLMASELMRLDQQRRDFVAAASHEMRTPIASILALADALLADKSSDIALYKDYVHDISQECDRARHLMDRLLELARLEGSTLLGHKHEEHQASVELSALCLDIVDALHSQAARKRILVKVDAPKDIWIKADPWLVETVIINLVENAIKYTPEAGRIQLIVQQSATKAKITVSDTGPGISSEHLSRLFERFYRVDKSRARATGGVGLGLTIAAEATRLLNGQLEVQSTLGQGTTFALVLPK